MPLPLPDTSARDWAGLQRTIDQLRKLLPTQAGNVVLAPNSVTDVELRSDAANDGLRAVTRNHIRNGAVDGSKLDASIAQAKRFSLDVGDGVATAIVVTHNFGTRDVVVAVRSNSAPFADVATTAVERTSINSVTVRFAAAPAANAVRVTVLA